MTLVAKGHQRLESGALIHNGCEIPPNALTDSEIERWLDDGKLVEVPERRSLYATFSMFASLEIPAGSFKAEAILSDPELEPFCLPPVS
jgi:hypothetical protein